MNIPLEIIFTKDQLEHLKDHKEKFEQIIEKIKKVPISVKPSIMTNPWVINFNVNGVKFSYPDYESLNNEIDILKKDFNERIKKDENNR